MRPHLEYASTVIYKKDCIAIENVQRRATRLVHGVRNLNYTERMKELGLPSLQYRRTRADMVKIMNGIDKSDKDQLFTVQSEARTRGHTKNLFKKQIRLDLRKHFFFFHKELLMDGTVFQRNSYIRDRKSVKSKT